MRCLYAVGAFLLTAFVSMRAQTVTRAYCADDGTVHMVYGDGTETPQPKEPLQVRCDSATIADDRETVGWSVLVDNCCTSYPIAQSVAVLSHGQKPLYSTNQMVWRWRFTRGANRLALLSGPVHGNASEAILYDVPTGRRLATWNGRGRSPAWASGWKQEFGPS